MEWNGDEWISPTGDAPFEPDIVELPPDWTYPGSSGFGSGANLRGDIIGPWIFEDCRTLINQCRYLRNHFPVAFWFTAFGYGQSVALEPDTYASMAGHYTIWEEPDQYLQVREGGNVFAPRPFAGRGTDAGWDGPFPQVYNGSSAAFEVFAGGSEFVSLSGSGDADPWEQRRTFRGPMSKAFESRLYFAAQSFPSRSDGSSLEREFHPQGTSLLGPGTDGIARLTLIDQGPIDMAHPRFQFGDASIPLEAADASRLHSLGYSITNPAQEFGGTRWHLQGVMLIYDFAVEGGFTHRPPE